MIRVIRQSGRGAVVNFGNPSFSLTNAQSFGKISNVVSNPRLLQAALRFEF